MKKKVFVSAVVLVFIVILTVIYNKNSIPDEITNFLDEYMKVCIKEVPVFSVEYCYFKTDEEKLAYINSYNPLIEYKIESSKKINNNLYEFTNLIETERGRGYYMRVYNFVARIDGKLYFISNVLNVPEEIQQNLDIKLYSYK